MDAHWIMLLIGAVMLAGLTCAGMALSWHLNMTTHTDPISGVNQLDPGKLFIAIQPSIAVTDQREVNPTDIRITVTLDARSPGVRRRNPVLGDQTFLGHESVGKENGCSSCPDLIVTVDGASTSPVPTAYRWFVVSSGAWATLPRGWVRQNVGFSVDPKPGYTGPLSSATGYYPNALFIDRHPVEVQTGVVSSGSVISSIDSPPVSGASSPSGTTYFNFAFIGTVRGPGPRTTTGRMVWVHEVDSLPSGKFTLSAGQDAPLSDAFGQLSHEFPAVGRVQIATTILTDWTDNAGILIPGTNVIAGGEFLADPRSMVFRTDHNGTSYSTRPVYWELENSALRERAQRTDFLAGVAAAAAASAGIIALTLIGRIISVLFTARRLRAHTL